MKCSLLTEALFVTSHISTLTYFFLLLQVFFIFCDVKVYNKVYCSISSLLKRFNNICPLSFVNISTNVGPKAKKAWSLFGFFKKKIWRAFFKFFLALRAPSRFRFPIKFGDRKSQTGFRRTPKKSESENFLSSAQTEPICPKVPKIAQTTKITEMTPQGP